MRGLGAIASLQAVRPSAARESPARGIDGFLDALRMGQPGIDMPFPSHPDAFGRLQHGAFVE
jgi:hypothetical protein